MANGWALNVTQALGPDGGRSRSDRSATSAVDRLRTALEARDLDAAVALLAPDVVFRSPIVHKPYHGPEAVRALLEGVLAVFEDFRYERAIGAPDAADHALVFACRDRRPRDRGLRLPARERRRPDRRVHRDGAPADGRAGARRGHARPLRGRGVPGALGQRPVVHRLVRVHVLAVGDRHPPQRLGAIQPLALVEPVEGGSPARRRRSASSRSGARSRPAGGRGRRRRCRRARAPRGRPAAGGAAPAR